MLILQLFEGSYFLTWCDHAQLQLTMAYLPWKNFLSMASSGFLSTQFITSSERKTQNNDKIRQLKIEAQVVSLTLNCLTQVLHAFWVNGKH